MNDNLEQMLNEVPWLRAEPMTIPRVTDNAKNESQATDSKKTRFFQRTGNRVGTIGTLIAAIGLAVGCSTTPTIPDDKLYDHAITIKNPVYLQDGSPAAGNFTVTMNGTDHPGNFDQKLVLPKTKKKIELCQVVLNTTGLKRTYRTGEITDNTQLAPSVIRLPFPIQTYLDRISPIGSNPMYGDRDVDVTWNPNQGLVVNDTQKNAVITVIYDPNNPLDSNSLKMWSWVPNWPANDQFFLKNITYADGTNPLNGTPSNGSIWVFPEAGGSTSHTCYPANVDYVMAFKLYLGQFAAANNVANETQGSFPDRQGIGGDADLADWCRLMFNRPNTSDYALTLTGEFQDGFDARSTATPTNITSMLGSAVDIEMINTINYETDEEAARDRTLLNQISRPSYGGFSSPDYTIPGRNLPVIKPGDKRAQENKREKY